MLQGPVIGPSGRRRKEQERLRAGRDGYPERFGRPRIERRREEERLDRQGVRLWWAGRRADGPELCGNTRAGIFTRMGRREKCRREDTEEAWMRL